MKTEQSRIPGVILLEPPTLYRDERGKYVETWNKQDYENAINGVIWKMSGHEVRIIDKLKWVQDDISVSWKSVLRGIHGDWVTWKLVSCLYGKFFLVVVDFRDYSPTYLQYECFLLDAVAHQQVLIPPGCGNGHYVLSDQAIFHYKQTTYYRGAESQFTVKWDDPKLNIDWPKGQKILSERDKGAPNV